MKQWDRELSIKRDTKREDALELIRFALENNVPVDATRNRLHGSFGYDNKTIEELFTQIEAESLIKQ